MELLVIDFETYYAVDFTLSKMTTEAYVRDPRFEMIGVGILDSQVRRWLKHADFVEYAKGIDWSKTAVLAHHAHFDGLILSHHYGISPGFWFDTLSMARAVHGTEVGNSLSKMAIHYNLGKKGTEVVQAKGKHFADFTRHEWNEYGGYCYNDCELEYALLKKLLPHFPQSELCLIDKTVRMFTEPRIGLDEVLLQELLADEQQRKVELLAKIEADRDTLMSNDKFAALLLEMGIDPPQKASPTATDANGEPRITWALAKSDPGFKALLEHEVDEVRWLAEARVGHKSTLNETRTGRMLAACAGNRRVPIYLKYSAAHTHRWGGGDKMNWQNLERTNKRDPKKGRIRKAITAPEGHVLVVGDSAQIEARMTAWLAGHGSLIEAFAQNRDVYSEFAAKAYGRKVDRKNNPDDETPGFLGKVCILGLGFGMGWLKFSGELLKGAMGGPPVQFIERDIDVLQVDPGPFLSNPKNVERIEALPSRLGFRERLVHCAIANALVDRYRAENAPIVALWKLADKVIDMLFAGDEMAFGPRWVLSTTADSILLPNGMYLRYPQLERTDRGEYSYLNGRKRTKIYGAKMVENIVQALARIVVADQLLMFGDRYPIVTTTHDEIVGLAPEADAQNALALLMGFMRTAPAWAHGLPLAAEGGFHKVYGLAKH